MASLYSSAPSRPGRAAASFMLALPAFAALAAGTAGCGKEKPARPDVLLVILSGTRADHTSIGGYHHDTTPTLKELAATGTVFEGAVTTAPWSLAATASILTGRYLSEHAVVFDHPILEGSLETLSEKMRAAGYSTGAVVTDPAIGSGNGFAQGIDHFVGLDPQQEGSPDDGAATAEMNLSAWLETRGGNAATTPLFGWVVLTNPRLPFAPPAEFQQKFLEQPIELPRLERLSQLWLPFARQIALGIARIEPEEMSALKALYDGEIAYADYRLGRILDGLKKAGTLDDTLVIVTSDSGEDLGDHELLADASNLYEPVVRVPLVMRLPGRVPAGRRETAQVQTRDLFDAILKLSASREGELSPDAIMPPRAETILEAPADPTALRGYLELAPDADLTAFQRNLIAVRTQKSKYLVSSRNMQGLFDLAADPAESRSALEAQPDEAKRLATVLGQWVATLQAPAWIPPGRAGGAGAPGAEAPPGPARP